MELLVRNIYGLKYDGSEFRNHLEDCIKHMVYMTCIADPDISMKPIVRPDDDFEYCVYIIIYVYEIFVMHHNAESFLQKLNKYLKLNPGSIGGMNIYSKDKMGKMILDNRVWEWEMILKKYVHESFINVEKYILEIYDKSWNLNNWAENTFFMGN